MTTPNEHLPPANELTDAELDAVLAAGDAGLLDHVRAHADPATTLAAMLDDTRDIITGRSSSSASTPSPPGAVGASRIRARTLAHGLAHDLAQALDRAHALDPADALTPDLAGALAHDLGVALTNAHDLVSTLTPADDPPRFLIYFHGLANTLARTIDHADDRSRRLFRLLSLARIGARTRTRIRALLRDTVLDLDHACSLARDLAALPVNASGADLTGIEMSDRAVLDGALDGVMWDEATRWPPGLREQVTDLSEEIKPGVYRVRGGTERDPHAVRGR